MNYSPDNFIRTTEKRHYVSCQALWQKLVEAGDIYLGKYAGWYSVRDEAFYAEDETTVGPDGKRRAGPVNNEVEWVEEPSYFGRKSEKVGRLLDPLGLVVDRSGAALAVGSDRRLVLGIERLVAHRVPAGIFAEIDVARLDQLLPQRLAGDVVTLLRGADEVVRAVVHHPDEVAKGLADLVGEGLRLHAGGFGCFLDFLAMFIGARQEADVVTVEALEAGHHVACQRCVGVPDMGHVVYVVDRRCAVERTARHD